MNNIEIAKLAIELINLVATYDLSNDYVEELFERYFKKIKKSVDK